LNFLHLLGSRSRTLLFGSQQRQRCGAGTVRTKKLQTDQHSPAVIDRVALCRAAIEPLVRQHQGQSDKPFIDADNLVEIIYAEYGRDGWSHGEVGAAIYEIASSS
jgi:hypothetical protein